MTKRVAVYWNLHKHTWSVKGPEGRVIMHADEVVLGEPGKADCKFTVGELGRLRVRMERVKNVHAFARGPYWASCEKSGGCDYVNKISQWFDLAQANDDPLVVGVTYNPYKHVHFVDTKHGAEAHGAKWIHLDKSPSGFPVVRACFTIDQRLDALETLKHKLSVRQWQIEGKSLMDHQTAEERAELKIVNRKLWRVESDLTALYGLSLRENMDARVRV